MSLREEGPLSRAAMWHAGNTLDSSFSYAFPINQNTEIVLMHFEVDINVGMVRSSEIIEKYTFLRYNLHQII